jgi:hypothetical protein
MLKKWDYVYIGLLILLGIFVVYSVSQKIREPFTEMYFEDYKNLPKLVENSTEFSFTIFNHETMPYTYQIRVIAENYRQNAYLNYFKDIDEFNVTLQDEENRTFTEKVSLDDNFITAKIQVIVVNKNQNIFFWADYAKTLFLYPEYGRVSLDCFSNIVNVPSLSLINIYARGSYGQGWPYVLVLLDGNLLRNQSIVSNATQIYRFATSNLSGGFHLLDVVFRDDFYNRTVLPDNTTLYEDRNIYISNISLDTYFMSKDNYLLDNGKGIQAVDCKDIVEKQMNLYSPGALRFRINVTG